VVGIVPRNHGPTAALLAAMNADGITAAMSIGGVAILGDQRNRLTGNRPRTAKYPERMLTHAWTIRERTFIGLLM
jgi:hypothetical protein